MPDPETMEAFVAAMNSDFNTSEALAALFEAVREGNSRIDRGADAGPWAAAVAEILEVLGVDPGADGLADLAGPLADLASAHGVEPGDPEAVMDRLIAARSRARAARDWGRADAIRSDLAGIGVLIEDSADGARWYRK